MGVLRGKRGGGRSYDGYTGDSNSFPYNVSILSSLLYNSRYLVRATGRKNLQLEEIRPRLYNSKYLTVSNSEDRGIRRLLAPVRLNH